MPRTGIRSAVSGPSSVSPATSWSGSGAARADGILRYDGPHRQSRRAAGYPDNQGRGRGASSAGPPGAPCCGPDGQPPKAAGPVAVATRMRTPDTGSTPEVRCEHLPRPHPSRRQPAPRRAEAEGRRVRTSALGRARVAGAGDGAGGVWYRRDRGRPAGGVQLDHRGCGGAQPRRARGRSIGHGRRATLPSTRRVAVPTAARRSI